MKKELREYAKKRDFRKSPEPAPGAAQPGGTTRVFVVHRQTRYNSATETTVDAHDMRSAHRFGELRYLLPNEASPFEPEIWIPKLHEGLEEIAQEDYILLVGNPALIAWAAGIATDYASGMLRLLQWDRKSQCYEVIVARLFEEESG